MAVGRLHFEITGESSQLQSSLQHIIASAEKMGVSVRDASSSLIRSFENALNPTTRFAEKITALEHAGKSSAEIWAVYGTKMQAFAATAERNGQVVDPVIQKHIELNKTVTVTGSSFENLGKTITDFARNPVQAAKAGIESILTSLGPTGVAFAGIASGVVAAGAAIFKFMSDAAGTAESLKNLSLMTGISVRDLQAFKQITKEAGLEGLDLGRVISKLNQELGSPAAGDFEKGLKALGITTTTTSGAQRDAIDILDDLRTKLLEINDPTERVQVATAVLGTRQRELIPLLLGSTEGLRDQIEAMKQNVTWSDETQKSLLRYDDALDKLGRTWETWKINITTALSSVIDWFGKVAAVTDSWHESLRKSLGIEAFQNWINGLFAVDQANQKVTASTAKLTTATKEGEGATLGLLKAALAKEEADKKAAAAAQKHADEVLRQKKAYEEALAPAAKVAQQIADMALATGKSEQALKLHGDALLKAAAKQIELTGTLDDFTASMVEATLEQQHLSKAVDAGKAAAITAEAAWIELDEIIDRISKRDLAPMFDSAAKAAKKLSDEIKDMKPIPATVIESIGHTGKELLAVHVPSDEIRAEMEKIPGLMSTTGEKSKNAFLNQVSTIGTDLSKSIVDGIMSGQMKIVDTLKELGKSLLRALVETFINPLTELASSLFGGLLKGLTGLFTGKGFNFGSIFGSAAQGAGGSWLGNLLGIGATGGGILGLGSATAAAATTAPLIVGGEIAGAAGGAAGGGLFAGIGSAISSGLSTVGSAISSGFSAIISGLATVPIWGWLAAGGVGLVAAIKLLTKDAYDHGAKEAFRDLGVILSSDMVQSFVSSVGLSKQQFEGIRKDILVSPKFLQEIVVPTALATGKMDELLASLRSVDTVMGTIDLSGPLQEFLATGNADKLNAVYAEMFAKSSALVAIMPDFATKLAAIGTTAAATATSIETVGAAVAAVSDPGLTGLSRGLNATAEATEQVTQSMGRALPGLTEAAKQAIALAERMGRDIPGGAEAARNAIDKTVQSISNMRDAFADVGQTPAEAMGRIGVSLQSVKRDLTDVTIAVNQVAGAFGTWYGLVDSYQNPNDPLRFIPTAEIGSSISTRGIQSAQHGGFVERGGLVNVHAGETIVPASTSPVTINIAISAVDGADVARVWQNKLEPELISRLQSGSLRQVFRRELGLNTT